jgi:hypothetical protein
VWRWRVIRPGGWTAGSGRCGWLRLVRPRRLRAGPGMSGSTESGSSPRMPCGPVTRCGCAARDANASWSSSRSSPSGSARRLPSRATSTTALPLRPVRRRSRWLPGTAVRAVRPSASAAVSTSCSGARPAERTSGASPDDCGSYRNDKDGDRYQQDRDGTAQARDDEDVAGAVCLGPQMAGDPPAQRQSRGAGADDAPGPQVTRQLPEASATAGTGIGAGRQRVGWHVSSVTGPSGRVNAWRLLPLPGTRNRPLEPAAAGSSERSRCLTVDT